MALAIPLLIMLALLASAWGLGVLARSRDVTFMKVAGAAGVIAVLLLPVAFEGALHDGNCLDVHGATAPCTLSQRIWNSIELGFAFTVPPAIMWLTAFVVSARIPK